MACGEGSSEASSDTTAPGYRVLCWCGKTPFSCPGFFFGPGIILLPQEMGRRKSFEKQRTREKTTEKRHKASPRKVFHAAEKQNYNKALLLFCSNRSHPPQPTGGGATVDRTSVAVRLWKMGMENRKYDEHEMKFSSVFVVLSAASWKVGCKSLHPIPPLSPCLGRAMAESFFLPTAQLPYRGGGQGGGPGSHFGLSGLLAVNCSIPV
ncbi:uncharacterized protein LOC118506257 [Anopheles stephensi]|uniref:uncharacterized protein LOC118506257 n=1 Tax=Anopheles stephensi TaxID=30069 RepID=UPI00165880CE|nr:uncharacterized protein LOC118506257 [Anopheles stephensi]